MTGRKPGVSPRRKATQAPAVTRAVAILNVLSASREPLGVSAIARQVDLIPSSCLHILRALAEEGLVRTDAAKRYSVGPGVLTLARQLIRRGGFSSVVQPSLELLAHSFGVTAIGLRIFGLDPLAVVAIANPDRPWHLHLDVGDIFPALTSATGRCVAAFGGFTRAELVRAFGAARWERQPAQAEWFGQVDAAKRQGYAVDEGNFMKGVIVLSAPILKPDATMDYAITVAGIREQIEEIGIASVTASLLEVTHNVGKHLSETFRSSNDVEEEPWDTNSLRSSTAMVTSSKSSMRSAST
jgi:DNA-binding IclR family transcriptional regulator